MYETVWSYLDVRTWMYADGHQGDHYPSQYGDDSVKTLIKTLKISPAEEDVRALVSMNKQSVIVLNSLQSEYF